ncbi:RNA dependent RNA polymerase-domain-containing protein [Corynascus similis CBS 632.67]
MANALDGDYQHLLLQRVDNKRVQIQQESVVARPAIPRNTKSSRKDNEQIHSGRRPGPVVTSCPSSDKLPLRPRQTAVPLPAAWSSHLSTTIVIKPLPTNVNPWDVSNFFGRFGNVVWVKLDQPSSSICRSAKIRFEPPPTDLSFFQQGRCKHNLGGSSSWARVEFSRQYRKKDTLTTPLGNTCPTSMSLQSRRLTFGLLTQPTVLMLKRDVNKLGGDPELRLTADFLRQKFIIHFSYVTQEERQYYRLDVKFGIIQQIYRDVTATSTLVINLKDPPLARKKQTQLNGAAWENRFIWREEELWHRVVEIRPDTETPNTRPVSLDEQSETVDLGRWTTYLLDLDEAAEEQWLAIETHLRDWNIVTNVDLAFARVPSRVPELWDMLSDAHCKMSVSPSWTHDLALLSSSTHIALPYDVRYQMEVCISRGILCEYNIEREWLEKLVEMSNASDPGTATRARLMLEYAADEGRPIYDPMELFQDCGAMSYYPTTLHIPDYCALVRKVIVTPTRIYFSTPTVETTNRVVRRYRHVQDHFIRVQFTDEMQNGRIGACDVDRDDELYTRVCRVMTQGIRMGKWHWKFLAYGNSQIRESGAFFFCEPEDGSVTCDSIRQWMGNFDHILSVPKFAARLGQCFSTTRLLHYISSPRIVEIDDVETKDGVCYTDGVGKISLPLASLVAEHWELNRPPSAIQFRMGGCKGILVNWPDVKGTEVHIRPSQRKFPAVYNGLEIIRCSQFSCASLNRQTILILSCLGVPDEVFIDMMAAQIADYDAAMIDKNKAVELLDNYVDENMITTTIAAMLRNGFMHTREPFVRTVLQLWRSWSIKGLKEKAKLVVEQGAFVLGCADETGTLRGHSRATEGRKNVSRDQLPQIFLQVPDPKNRREYKVITGLCIVGRNPSLHPGDIRVVEAVDIPKLRHIRDVVVFPLRGDRDVPSMCSGGDLDGDDFFVIWDPRLLPTEWSHPPMEYSAPEQPTEPRSSVAKSLAFFFVLFMKNDILPLIAHAHLATADYEAEGAKHWKCLQLAERHSTAVDYAKTGVPAQLNKQLSPRKYPHFMEKPKYKTYHSTSILGKLYDMVDREVFDNKENYILPFDDRILKRYKPDSILLKEARKIKGQYDISMRRIMGQLEIRTEFEIWTTFVMSKPRVGSDYKVQEKVGREAAGLKKQFRDLCLRVIEEHNFDKLEFIAGMYRVTWEETKIALHESRQPHVLPNGTVGLRRVTARSMPLISFPWLFPAELGKIALDIENIPNMRELGITPPSAKPMSGKDRVVQLEPELDLAGMEYARTSDGQIIHRGQILHLFRHNDDDSDDHGGFYCDDDTAGVYSVTDSASESMPNGELKESQRESPNLFDLNTASDDTEFSTRNTASSSAEILALPRKTGGLDASQSLLNLLLSDTDAGSDSPPYLYPVKCPNTQEQHSTNLSTAQTSTTTQAARLAAEVHSAENAEGEAEEVETSDAEMEYEEDVVEVVRETTLEEAAARFDCT